VPALAPGAASTEATTVTLPAGAAGTFWLGALADLDGAVAEASEANNALAASSPLTVGAPDLVIAAVTGPATAAPGGSITVSATVANTGNAPSAPSRVGIYLSTDATIGAGDVLLGSRSVPALAPGAASTEATTVTLPADTAGTFWLGALADLDGAVAEASEANNALAASSSLLIGAPDLVVAAVTGSATAAPGGSITVTTTVTNAGTLASVASRAGIYLSTDATIGAGDVLLGARSVPALSPGAASTEATTVTLPAGAAGTFWLGAVADLDGVVAEASEANNALAASSPLTVGAPDLVVAAVTGPGTAAPGGSFTVTTTVTNTGTLASAASRVGIYLSSDATIGAGDVLIGARSVPALAPGAASTEATTVTLPADAAGTYWLGAVADLDGLVAEGDETNNALAASSPLAVSQTNLAVVSVNGPVTAYPGSSIPVTTIVTNRGAASAAPCMLGVYLFKGPVATPSDLLLSRATLPGLAAGASTSLTVMVDLPPTLKVGPYYLAAIADLDGTVPESSEADNSLAGSRLNVMRQRY
jgi:subtilase family serine protease